MKDAEVLYNVYMALGDRFAAKKKAMDPKKDKEMLSGIAPKISLMLMRLTYSEDLRSVIETQKNIMAVKAMYIQYSLIRGRNPDYVKSFLSKNMDQLIRAVCDQEARMIDTIRLQETGGDRIDIQKIFEDKKNWKRLGNTLAHIIVSDSLRHGVNKEGFTPTCYITGNGKKYHRRECPYCKGRKLTEVTLEMAKNQKLEPCKCFDEVDHSCVTAFIDESIHTVAWNKEGKKGRAGSYSYIICWGNLPDENSITGRRTVTRGVGYTEEINSVRKITDTAIGKVLLLLAYEYEFAGMVRIFTDNKSAADYWKSVQKNYKLAKLFLSVQVKYTPREKNTKADKLGRSRVFLNIPSVTYQAIVDKCHRVRKLEKQIRKLEEKSSEG